MATPQDAKAIGDMLSGLHTLLPCIICARDFPRALSAVVSKRKETVEQAVMSSHLVDFMYDVHNEVNRKLSRQRYEKLRRLIPSLPLDADSKVLDILESTLSLNTLQRRTTVFKDCPWNLNAIWILILIMSNRVDNNETLQHLIHFMTCVSYYAGKNMQYDARISSSMKSTYLKLNEARDYKLTSKIVGREYTAFANSQYGSSYQSVQDILSNASAR